MTSAQFNLLVTIPFPALLVRRLHDLGLHGWWVLPSVGIYGLWLLRSVVAGLQGIEARIALDQQIWPLDWAAIAVKVSTIVLLCLPGARGTNRFGPDPRG